MHKSAYRKALRLQGKSHDNSQSFQPLSNVSRRSVSNVLELADMRIRIFNPHRKPSHTITRNAQVLRLHAFKRKSIITFVPQSMSGRFTRERSNSALIGRTATRLSESCAQGPERQVSQDLFIYLCKEDKWEV